ncbi:MAG: 16S rRNA (cytidine(1402)-2'-O)-methyltransferase [Gammaproteobacteria bacterium]|nr:16S rRNA (cytidine(1402)-2'-O)-methyltransferase [Gammaproteobacteria bacterium]
MVATPIGNLGDLSARAAATLAAVDLVLVEDTRVTGRLFQHLAIRTPMLACHDHNERELMPAILQRLQAGESAALVSDAGTPVLNDPGYLLVQAAHAAGIPVRAVAGPSAMAAALSVAGMPAHSVRYEGFLPARAGARRAMLERLATETATVVLFEAPHRIAAALADIAAVFGAPRELCVCRELTKLFETVRRGRAGELAAWFAAHAQERRGEFVLVVAGAPRHEAPGAGAETVRVLDILMPRLPLREAVAATVAITGEPRNVVYALAVGRQRGA